MVKGDYVMLNFEKINKVKARKLFNSGENIYLLPCKLRLNNAWCQPIMINNSMSDFDALIDRATYYNCNSEIGDKLSFYTWGN